MQTSTGMPSDAIEHQDMCRILQVKASTRTRSADAKQVDFGAGSASIHPSNAAVTDLLVLLGWEVVGRGDISPGSICEIATDWSVSQGISQQLPECCLTALSASSVTAQEWGSLRIEADKGLRIPSSVGNLQCPKFSWGHLEGATHPAPSQHILDPAPHLFSSAPM